METIKIEVSTNCECMVCQDCRLGTVGMIENCEDCGGATTFSNDCFDCQPFDWLYEELDNYFSKFGREFNAVRINGMGMGWQGSSGYAVVPSLEAERIVQALAINGEYRLQFTIGETITARRWSHDEPMGSAQFTFTPMREE